MTDMAMIKIILPKALSDWGALPAKIRMSSGKHHSEGTSNDSFGVEPGRYLVSIRIPNGEELFADDVVEVESGAEANVAIAAPTKATQNRIETRSNLKQATGMPGGSPAQTMIWKGRLFDTDIAEIGSGPLDVGPELSVTAQRDVIALDTDKDQFLVLRYPAPEIGEVCRLTIIPHDVCLACVGDAGLPSSVTATILAGSHPPMIRYASKVSTEANSLLSFIETSALGEMEQVSQSFVRRGQQAMLDSQMSLLLGAMGAYVLLRINIIDGLEEWVNVLDAQTKDLPDIHVLRAELMARLGRHDEAIAALGTALAGRSPWFRSGYSYLVDRVRYYLAVHDSNADSFKLSKAEQFQTAKQRFDEQAAWVVQTTPFLTFDVPDQTALAASQMMREVNELGASNREATH